MDIFVCPARVIREGRLICFEGQVMSKEEAVSLGLTEVFSGKAEDGKPVEPTKGDICARLDELGIAYNKKDNKAALTALLAEAEAAQFANGESDNESGNLSVPSDTTNPTDSAGANAKGDE